MRCIPSGQEGGAVSAPGGGRKGWVCRSDPWRKVLKYRDVSRDKGGERCTARDTSSGKPSEWV